MFDKRHTHRVQAFLMSVLMVLIMTFLVTALNTGLTSGFMGRWGKAMLVAWPIAFIIILSLGRRVQQLALMLCSKE